MKICYCCGSLVYQAPIIKSCLIKAGAGSALSLRCVGWHWFSYMDNDPTGGSDSSNMNSNKGIVSWDYQHCTDVATHMSAVNKQTYNLARFMN